MSVELRFIAVRGMLSILKGFANVLAVPVLGPIVDEILTLFGYIFWRYPEVNDVYQCVYVPEKC